MTHEAEDRVIRRLRRYGSCMAQIRIVFDEIRILYEDQYLPIRQAVLRGKADFRSKNRATPLLRYLYLNIRIIVEQIAFGMALADADALSAARLRQTNVTPKEILSALRKGDVDLSRYPEPVRAEMGDHLHRDDFVGLYGHAGSVVHTMNPLAMEVKHGIHDDLTAPARDADHALKQARDLNESLAKLRNLLAEHTIANSFDGCGRWEIRMCDEDGHVALWTQYGDYDVSLYQHPEVEFDPAMFGFWACRAEFPSPGATHYG